MSYQKSKKVEEGESILIIKDTLISFLLLASLVFVLGACSDSELSSKKDSTCFELNEDKTQVIGYLETAENGEACPKDVVIPNGVTNIAENAFKDQGLTSVEIHGSVTEVGAYAFVGNSFSSYVYIPNENANVDTSAFDSSIVVVVEGTESCFIRDTNDSTTLTDYFCLATIMEVPDDVTNIADSVFENKGLTSVTLSQNLTSIGNNAFKDNNLESLDIPNSVTDIGDSAFAGNSFSSYVYIPNENANVDTSAFDSSIVVVVEGTESCFVRDSNNATILAHYPCSASTVEIPSDITSIADEVFENKGLTSVTLSQNLTSIGNNAFKDNNLESLDIPNSVTDIGDSAFMGNSFSSYVYIPNENANVDTSAFDFSIVVVVEGTESCFVRDLNNATILAHYLCSASTVEIPSDITSIADEVFENKGLTSVTLPQNLTSIGNNAFKDNNLESLDIPDSVIDIGDSAFAGNSDLELYIFPSSSNPTVGNNAFPNGYAITTKDVCFEFDATDTGKINDYYDNEDDNTSKPACPRDVVIPQGVISIGAYAFDSNSLTSVEIPDSVTDIGDSAFAGNSDLELYIFPSSSNPTVGNNAFPNGYAITTKDVCFEFDATDTGKIKDYYDNEDDNTSNPACPKDVVIPQGVTSIGINAFKNTSLTSVIIPDSVISIGIWAFYNNSLTSVNIPNSVTSISNYAFSYNSLTSVEIPEGVTSIGDGAFSNNSLTSVIIPDSVISIGLGAFYNNSLTSVEIPDSVTSIGDNAFYYNALTSVTIGSGVTSIGEEAFKNNESSLTICIEAQQSDVTVNSNVFDSGITPTYETDGDCFS